MENMQLSTSVTGLGEPDYNALLVEQWVLTSRSENTREQYRRVASRLFDFVGNIPFDTITLAHLQAYVASLEGMSASSITLHIMAIKSLYTFAGKLGAIRFNLASLLVAPAVEDKLAERIIEETDVVRMIALETNKRDHALLRLMYATGLRASEVAALEWSNIKKREQGAQIAVYGKGGKTRYVPIGQSLYNELKSLDEQHGPVFKSRKGGACMSRVQITRIVSDAAKRAGIDEKVSAHWLRHANASHALDNGATIAVVQASLGHSSLLTTGRYTHARPTDGTANYIHI